MCGLDEVIFTLNQVLSLVSGETLKLWDFLNGTRFMLVGCRTWPFLLFFRYWIFFLYFSLLFLVFINFMSFCKVFWSPLKPFAPFWSPLKSVLKCFVKCFEDFKGLTTRVNNNCWVCVYLSVSPRLYLLVNLNKRDFYLWLSRKYRTPSVRPSVRWQLLTHGMTKQASHS